MRQLAAVVGSIGLLLAAWAALTPVSVDVPHGDGRCGVAAVRWVAQEGSKDPNEQAIIDRCEDAAESQLVLAGFAAGAGIVGFLGLRIAARRHDKVERRRRQARRLARLAEESEAQDHHTRVEAAPARDAALRG